MKWKSITSAPKDGTPIIGCVADDDNWSESYAQWQAPVTIAWRPFHSNQPGKTCWRVADGRPYYPTHWAPLPKSPAKRDS